MIWRSASSAPAFSLALQSEATVTQGSTYLSQSLPFGGCGQSGFDRFAGPEGLRGLTMPRSVSEDAFDFFPFGIGVLFRTAIPPPLQARARRVW